jgi:hypothetical protein
MAEQPEIILTSSLLVIDRIELAAIVTIIINGLLQEISKIETIARE